MKFTRAQVIACFALGPFLGFFVDRSPWKVWTDPFADVTAGILTVAIVIFFAKVFRRSIRIMVQGYKKSKSRNLGTDPVEFNPALFVILLIFASIPVGFVSLLDYVLRGEKPTWLGVGIFLGLFTAAWFIGDYRDNAKIRDNRIKQLESKLESMERRQGL
jgi:hypothetical protein